jgi:hypothetical protein
LSESLLVGALEALIRVAAEKPDLIARVWKVFSGVGVAESTAPLLMRKGEYAQRAGYSVRTVDKLIEAGLPTRGAGKLLRIVVSAADDWLLTQDTAEVDELDLLAMRNARKRGRTGEGSE